MYLCRKLFMAESLGVDCSANGMRRRPTWWLSNGIDFLSWDCCYK